MKRCLGCDLTFEGELWTCPSCNHAPIVKDGFHCFAPDLNGISAFDVHSFEDMGDQLDKSFWFPPRNRLINWALSKYFPKIETYLEIGCGTGYVLKGVADNNPATKFTATDIFTEGLVGAQKRLKERASFIQTNALHLPFREEFDVIGAYDVIEHIEEDVSALKELHRALKPGGGILMTVPRHMFLWSDVDTTAHHKRRYGGAELKKKIKEAGFDLVRQLSFGMVTLPLQYISRRYLLKKSEKHTDVLETDQSPIVRFVLEKLLDLDQIPIRMGVNYPLGASLMVIARKA
jgi:ubiquinone/menaquinone biosynthesis C-methylase UbiE